MGHRYSNFKFGLQVVLNFDFDLTRTFRGSEFSGLTLAEWRLFSAGTNHLPASFIPKFPPFCGLWASFLWVALLVTFSVFRPTQHPEAQAWRAIFCMPVTIPLLIVGISCGVSMESKHCHASCLLLKQDSGPALLYWHRQVCLKSTT